MRPRPAKSTAPAIHASFVPASMHADPGRSRGFASVNSPGSASKLPAPSASGATQQFCSPFQ